MTPAECSAIIAYLQEQRRHLLAQAKATERLIVALQGKKCYNDIDVTVSDSDSIATVADYN